MPGGGLLDEDENRGTEGAGSGRGEPKGAGAASGAGAGGVSLQMRRQRLRQSMENVLRKYLSTAQVQSLLDLGGDFDRLPFQYDRESGRFEIAESWMARLIEWQDVGQEGDRDGWGGAESSSDFRDFAFDSNAGEDPIGLDGLDLNSASGPGSLRLDDEPDSDDLDLDDQDLDTGLESDTDLGLDTDSDFHIDSTDLGIDSAAESNFDSGRAGGAGPGAAHIERDHGSRDSSRDSDRGPSPPTPLVDGSRLAALEEMFKESAVDSAVDLLCRACDVLTAHQDELDLELLEREPEGGRFTFEFVFSQPDSRHQARIMDDETGEIFEHLVRQSGGWSVYSEPLPGGRLIRIAVRYRSETEFARIRDHLNWLLDLAARRRQRRPFEGTRLS